MLKKFRLYFLIIFLVELLSFAGFVVPQAREAGFFIILAITLLLVVEKMKYGLYILLVELFIGSKGYLFFYDYDGTVISLRIAMFLIIMSAWLGKVLLKWVSTKQDIQDEIDKIVLKSKDTIKSFSDFQEMTIKAKKITSKATSSDNKLFIFYFLLAIFVIWGVINGYLQGNNLKNLFFDFNGWIYFGILFPVHYIWQKNKERITKVSQDLLILLSVTASWLSLKTLALLYIFSHDFNLLAEKIYRWVRVTGVGEVNFTELGFSRVFIQSQVFVVVGLFVFLSLILHDVLAKKKNLLIYYFIGLSLFISTTLVSFSRSFWLGLGMGLLIYCFLVFLFFWRKWKEIILTGSILILVTILSIGLVWTIVRFPVPQPLSGFNLSMLGERATSISGEAGVSSRWNLLPVLVSEIKQAPILGKGFGAEVTYISDDPRVREVSPDGKYTTYAFEWGWLDIWLKLGFFGMLAYVALLIKIFITGISRIKKSELKIQKLLYIALLSGLVMITVTSFFSPYLNHPLGIGYVVLVGVIFSVAIPTKNKN
ncbi:MAG: O-antigen ligase family protein [Candidatus Falkowbacteria bacterium]